MFIQAWKNKTLIWQLLRRDIQSRYRGSVSGLFWSLMTPLMMLAIYTFVFQFVFKARWNDTAGETTLSFAIVLFLGLSLHTMLMEIFTKTPVLITGNPNFVKKIVFPLEILPCITLLSALVTFLISLSLLVMFIFIELGRVPLTSLMLPLVLFPYLLMLLGIGWFLAGIGVYLRDIHQITGTLATLLLFMSPVFYSASSLPDNFKTLIFLNPLSFVVENSRKVLIYGQMPDLLGLLIYSLIAVFIAYTGYSSFKKIRPGFADVL